MRSSCSRDGRQSRSHLAPSLVISLDQHHLNGGPVIQADIECAVRLDANVLISGGDSAARAALARLIHERSAGKQRSLVVVGGGGPIRQQPNTDDAAPWPVSEAAGGTLFIEELAALDRDAQQQLMRLLDRGAEFVTDLDRDTRIISATAHDLQSPIAASRFNSELFYRLNVIHIALGATRRLAKPSTVH
ncbi:MAG: sigma 54-interacting transcriptional regulator [Vicinamibacterales bacterium]